MPEKNPGVPPVLEMVIELGVLEHLGLKMYNSLPAVISEYVANCWDAWATKVDITIPSGRIDANYAILISDNGAGMSVKDVQTKFLVVGRDKRKAEGSDTVTYDGQVRKMIGRKGLGKIAGFGVAGLVCVRTVRDGQFVEFEMDYDEMRRSLDTPQSNRTKTTYKPRVTGWGPIKHSNGTVVSLKRLKRSRAIDLKELRRGLALHFSILGRSFQLGVNGRDIRPSERSLRKACQFTWDYQNEYIDDTKTHSVTGWIGTMSETIPRDQERGVVVMTRGKLVQEATTFDVGGKGLTGQHGLAYLVGEIHADFLDDVEDLISTGRRSVVWEQEPAASLREWLNSQILKVCGEWADKRRVLHMQVIREAPAYQERIQNLPEKEKKIVDKFLSVVVKQENVDDETFRRVVDFAASNIEYQAFLEFVDSLEEAEVTNPELIIKFFWDWEVFDAIEMIRVVEGRYGVINKFEEMVASKVKETPDLHRFLADNSWLLDPSWDYLDDEIHFTKMLKQQFPDSTELESDRRIDFLCLGHGSTLNVVELKRPGSAIGRKQLEQLERYVDFVRSRVSTGGETHIVHGYIIGGHMSKEPDAIAKAERLAKDGMLVRTFDDLQKVAQKIHKRFIDILERKAKRIGDRRVTEGLDRLKSKMSSERADTSAAESVPTG